MTSSVRPEPITSGRLALVEGRDEVNLIGKMLEEMSLGGVVQVLNVGGKFGFGGGLRTIMNEVRTRQIGISAIGVLRDADNSASQALNSIASSLNNLGLPVPSTHGTFSGTSPAIGIFILPDGTNPGAIEDLCWQAVENSPAARCSAAYLECLQASNALASNNHSKTLVHAYLASRVDPSATVGVGALQGSWPLNHAAFDPLKTFLQELATI